MAPSVRKIESRSDCRGIPPAEAATKAIAHEEKSHLEGGFFVAARSGASMLRYDAYGFFGVLYSASFWNGFQTVS